MMLFVNRPSALWDRASRAYGHGRIFLHQNAFWRVRSLEKLPGCDIWRFTLIAYGSALPTAPHRSIDDCTPGEWSAASRAYFAQREN